MPRCWVSRPPVAIPLAAGPPWYRPAVTGRQLGPLSVLARQLVSEHAEAARLGQDVLLAVRQLAGGADPGVSDQGTGPPGRFGQPPNSSTVA